MQRCNLIFWSNFYLHAQVFVQKIPEIYRIHFFQLRKRNKKRGGLNLREAWGMIKLGCPTFS